MRLAVRDFRRTGDDASLARVLNDLAMVHLQQGDLGRGEALLRLAVDAGERGGAVPVASLCNLALIALQRGHPEEAEQRLRRAVAIYHRYGETEREAHTTGNLADALRDLGRVAEANRLLDEAIGVMRQNGTRSAWLAWTLVRRARVDIAAGRLAAVDATIDEIERIAEATADTRDAAMAHELRGRLGVVRDGRAAVDLEFPAAHRLLVASADSDATSELDGVWAEALLAMGQPDEALQVLARAAHDRPAPADSPAAFFAAALRARVAAGRGDLATARAALAELGAGAAESPSLERRLSALAARASVAAAEGRVDAARADLRAAVAVAQRLDSKVDELQLRLELATMAASAAERARLAGEIEREADQIGLPRSLVRRERCRRRWVARRHLRGPRPGGVPFTLQSLPDR